MPTTCSNINYCSAEIVECLTLESSRHAQSAEMCTPKGGPLAATAAASAPLPVTDYLSRWRVSWKLEAQRVVKKRQSSVPVSPARGVSEFQFWTPSRPAFRSYLKTDNSPYRDYLKSPLSST